MQNVNCKKRIIENITFEMLFKKRTKKKKENSFLIRIEKKIMFNYAIVYLFFLIFNRLVE